MLYYIGKSLFHGSRYALVDHCLKNEVLRRITVRKAGAIISSEISKLCSFQVDSILGLPIKSFKNFSWKDLILEMKHHSPTLLSLLTSFNKTTQKRSRSNPECIIGICTAILCKHRCNRMSFLQKLLSVMLYSGHTTKQVSS